MPGMQRRRRIRALRPHERWWNDFPVDKNLKDEWLRRLNALTTWNLISICEGIEERHSQQRYSHPHINLRAKEDHLPAVVRWFHTLSVDAKGILKIFDLEETTVDFVVEQTFSKPHGNLMRKFNPTMRIKSHHQRSSDDIDSQTVLWFEKTITEIEQMDSLLRHDR